MSQREKRKFTVLDLPSKYNEDLSKFEPKKDSEEIHKSETDPNFGTTFPIYPNFFPVFLVIIKISKKQWVRVQMYKGTMYVDIREYYIQDKQLKPSRKGISLPIKQWKKLQEISEVINDRVKTMIT